MAQISVKQGSQSFPTKAPALASDTAPADMVFDAVIGESAFEAQESALRSMDPSAVVQPNFDPSMAAIVALRFVNAARAAFRVTQFGQVAGLLGEHTIDELEQRAWALWYLESRLRSVTATTTGAKVNERLITEATAARARVMRLIDYNLDDYPLVLADLADIRQGQGFVDLANDLARLAGHVSVHRAILEKDQRNYRADDEAMLRGLAHEIIQSLQRDRGNETVDLRNRAFTRVVATYNNLKSAADFLFRNMPSDAAAFVPLRTGVIAMTARRPGVGEETTEPDTTTEPATPAVVPLPAPAATPPGMPGSEPFV